MITLQAKNISHSVNSIELWQDISITLRTGDCLILSSPSGKGKTTLLRILAGIDNPQKGDVLVTHNSTTPKKGFLFQDYHLWPHLNVFWNCYLPLLQLEVNHSFKKSLVLELLNKLDLVSYYRRFPSSLSGGQRQRVALARSIIHSPDLLFLDELTSGLDSTSKQKVIHIIRDSIPNSIIVISSHDQELIDSFPEARILSL